MRGMVVTEEELRVVSRRAATMIIEILKILRSLALKLLVWPVDLAVFTILMEYNLKLILKILAAVITIDQ